MGSSLCQRHKLEAFGPTALYPLVWYNCRLHISQGQPTVVVWCLRQSKQSLRPSANGLRLGASQHILSVGFHRRSVWTSFGSLAHCQESRLGCGLRQSEKVVEGCIQSIELLCEHKHSATFHPQLHPTVFTGENRSCCVYGPFPKSDHSRRRMTFAAFLNLAAMLLKSLVTSLIHS